MAVYEFVEPLPDDFTCPVCLEAVYDAKQTKCCGYHLCKSCSDRIETAESSKCPVCQTSPMMCQDDLWFRRKLNELKVYCPNMKKDCHHINRYIYPPGWSQYKEAIIPPCTVSGCDWNGPLSDADRHIETNCPFGEVVCKHGCNEKLFRHEIETHESFVCKDRPFECEYCRQFSGTAQDVCSHYDHDCEKIPINCPNSCEQESMYRCDLPAHLEQCPLQKMECEFGYAGCEAILQRKYYDSHMDTFMKTHLQLIARRGKEKDQEIAGLQKTVKVLTDYVDCMASILNRSDIIEISFHKDQLLSRYSQPFYLVPYGYRMTLITSVKDKVLHVFAKFHPGDFDDKLQWPFYGKIKLILLHASGDKHYEYIFEYLPGVTDNTKKGNFENCLKSSSRSLSIPYVTGNCATEEKKLKFRIVSVELKS